MYIKLAIIALYTLIVGGSVWFVQDWRWEAKQLAAVNTAVEMHNAEAKTAQAADNNFQKQKGKTDAKYQKLNGQINQQAAANPGTCFDPLSLQLLNTAVSRKAPAASRPAIAVPGPSTAQ